MLKLAIILLSFISNIFTPAMADLMTMDEIVKKTDGKGVFNITLINNNKKLQRVTIHTIAFLKNSEDSFYTSQSIAIAPQTTKTIRVQRPFCSPGTSSFSESSTLISSTPGERDIISEARIKLYVIDSTRRTTQVKYFIEALKYVGDTYFVDLPASTFVIR